MAPSSSKRRSSNQTSTRAEAIKAACKRADEQLQETPPPEPSTRDSNRDKDTKKSCSAVRKLSAAISDTDETDPNQQHHHHHTHSLNHNHRHATAAQAHHSHVHSHAQVQEPILLPSSSENNNDEDGCLHCHKVSTDIQVRCDECQAYICPGCHWCHEYQANHEIRVCDRCDAFYCRNCDEMDQCDDCGEVVCASCSTLLSCKFCGGGLCEECATACGRCGIVLCSRDAKFAVECDTCRLSYCLVCLASGSKDPCVRCGHRPSKRMEQLVHLRLKSIYKAFKQSSKSPKEQFEQFHNHDHALEHGPNISSASTTTTTFDEFTLTDGMPDITVPMRHHHQYHAKEESVVPSNTTSTSNITTTSPDALAEHVLEEKQKEADAAAEALLAELEEEEEAAKTKKSKKKKKKERLQKAKKKEDEPSSESVVPLVPSHSQSIATALPTTNMEKSTKAAPLYNDGQSSQYTPNSNSTDDKVAFPEENATITIRSTADPTLSTEQQPDPFEKRLCECVEESDIDGIEGILFELKGVPGRAALRKNAKKALKRLRAPTSAAAEDDEIDVKEEPVVQPTVITKQPVELLKLVSDNNIPGKQPNRAECVMQMSPQVVGWVIGKGGQRIRDLMEESGAKVWIDQEKAKPDEARNVYISGDRSSVDQAVHMVREIVSKAPIEGAAKYAPHVDDGLHKSLTVSPTQNPQEAGNRRTTLSMVNATAPIHVPIIAAAAESRIASTAQLKPRTMAAAIATATPAPSQPLTAPLRPAYQEDDQCEHLMTCEARFVPLLIGKRGWAVKDIQDKSGARVDIDQSVTPRQIRISGSRASVDKAIPMVRDVLNYPHAQPQPGFDTAHGVEHALETRDNHLQAQESSPSIAHVPEERQDTPPPYSFITTGDARSAISASSSLSSTPEPFMATASVKSLPAQLPPNTLLAPPEYRLPTISQMHAPSPVPRPYGQQDFAMGMNRVGDPGAFGPPQPALPPTMYSVQGLVGMSHIQGMGLPIPQQSHDHLNSHVPKPNPMPYGPTSGMHGQAPQVTYSNNGMVSSTANTGVHDNIQGGHAFGMNIPPPGSRNRGMGSMENTQQSQMGAYGPLPTGTSMGGGMTMQPGTPFDSRGENPFGSWESGPVDRSYGFPPGMAPGNLPPLLPGNLGLGPPPVSVFTNSFHLSAPPSGTTGTGAASSAPLNHGFDMGAGVRGRVPAMAPFNAQIETPNPSVSGNDPLRDDSRIIDSLFGPPSSTLEGKGTSVDDGAQRLITGLNALQLGTSGLPPGVSSGGAGLWGSSLTDWNNATVTTSQDLENITNESVLESSILAGLQPFPLGDDSHQHPSQSRFHWGSTNA